MRDLTPRFENLSLEQGLSQSSVYDILQDRNGFMWFTTQAGLNKWDGYEMKVYSHEPFDDNTLGAMWVLSVSESSDGTLWVGMQGAGLDNLDPVSDRVTHHRFDRDDPNSISSNRVQDTYEDTDGILWVATNRGLNRMSLDNPGHFTAYRHDAEEPSSISNDQVTSIFQDLSGRIWVSTMHGLNRLDAAKTGTFERFLTDEDRQQVGERRDENREVYRVVERPEEAGILWVGTEAGIVRLDSRSGESEIFQPNPQDPELNHVLSISQDPLNPGILWVPVYGDGLARFDVRLRTFLKYRADNRDPSTLGSNWTNTAYVDRSGMVWVGNDLDGVDRFNPASVGFAHYRSIPGDPSTLPGTNVWAIHQTRDGRVWVASDGDDGWHLSELDRSSGSARHFRANRADPTSLGGRIRAIHEDRVGILWVTSNKGLSWFERATGQFHTFSHDANDPTTIARGGVDAILEDHVGNLWLGAVWGLSRLGADRSGVFRNYNLFPADTAARPVFVVAIEEDPAGIMWIGSTFHGLVRLDPITGDVEHFQHDSQDPESLSDPWVEEIIVREREPGIVWIATSEGGLNRLDTATGKFRHWTKKDGLADNVLYSMVEDGEGRLWMGTNHGISRFDPDTETFRNYGLEIGLQSLEFTQGAAHIGQSGEMFFGGTNGVNAFFPNELSENPTPPELSLVDLKLANRSIREIAEIELEKPLTETEEIHLSHDQRDITFDFVALHFADSDNNEFAYQLEGFNDDWLYVGKQRSASFTNLPPGKYRFRVKAANSDGVWNEEGTSIRIVIEPPFWATWWFRFATIGLFGGLVVGGFRFRVRQIADRNKQLETEVEHRTMALRESNTQLEQSQTIVQTINRETSFRRLLTKILEESRVIPGVEKATAMVFLQDGFFHVRASSGWDVKDMQHIRLTPSQAHSRYIEQAEEVAEDIFVAKDVSDREAQEQLAEFGEVASFLVLRVRVEGQISGYLVFDNLTNRDAFDQRDAALLERLREHIQSAFIKTRILEDLQNTLDDLRSTQDRLVQSEKMASLGELTAGIAHEIKNPLNFVNNFSDVTDELVSEIVDEVSSRRADLPEDFVKELESLLDNLRLNTAKINEHGRRADGIVQNMLEHSQGGEGQSHPTNLNQLLDEYVTLAVHGQKARHSDFEVEVERRYDDAVGNVDLVPQEIGRVFLNLLSNAFDALREARGSKDGHGAPGGGSTVSVGTTKVGDNVEVRIADNGPGIPPSVKKRIFEPFFTTKPTGSGTGLGLSMSYDIVTKGHGGELTVVSEPGEGATFIVRLPL